MTTFRAKHINEMLTISKAETARGIRNIIGIADQLKSSMALIDIDSINLANNEKTLAYIQILLTSLGTWSKIAKDDINTLNDLLADAATINPVSI